MLTGKNTEPQQAVHYFLEGYYQEGESRWFGKGAQELGLSGAVDDQETFSNIVNGKSPDGTQQLSARKLNSSQRRAATDFTFSAPKSVSLQALVGGDERLITAHQLAVEKTLALIEERYSYTRATTEKGQQLIRTNNLVVAEFDHIQTRELDPHLHTHALVMNMTYLEQGRLGKQGRQRKQEKTEALSAQAAFDVHKAEEVEEENEVGEVRVEMLSSSPPTDSSWYSLLNDEIFKNKKFLGMVYQNYLAIELQKLGYEVEARKHGQFEIKGFREEDLKEFSKRRLQILTAVGQNSTWAEQEEAWTATRNLKQKMNPHELKAKWKEEAQALGIKFVQPKAAQPERQPRLISHDNLEDAIAHCSERNVAFTQEDLEKFILNQGLATDVSQIEPLIQANSQLLSLSPQTRDYTTLAAVNRELATIKLMQDGQGQVNALAHSLVVESHLETTALNSGQRHAILAAATTTDQFIAWQGVAGAGKTFALRELKALATSSGYTIKGFAPSSMAALVLGQELNIPAETVARLLASEPPQETEPHQIWIVDEAGLLSAKDALTFLERATLEQARVLLVGDTKQLSAVEAGNPFKSLQQAGIQTSYLNESLRQRAPKLKLAVDLIAEGRIEEGFERLDENGYIQNISAEHKIDTIARDYVTATPEQRARTLVLAGTNQERLEITQAIREHLKAEGSLGTATNITQLQAKDLTRVQMRYTHNFELGDMVMPTRSYKRRGLSKGKLYEVVGKDTERLTLKAEDGEQCEVDTGFHKAVYQRQEIEIAQGDRLRWTKNDRQLGRRNGQEFIVKEITGNIAQILYLDHSQTEFINLQQAQHLDYAIVSTTYSSQGKTADSVLIAADNTIGQESFYVAVSRAKHELKLYTEDKDHLLAQAQLSRAKENALFLLRQQELARKHQSKPEKQKVATTIVAKKPTSLPEITVPLPKTEVTPLVVKTQPPEVPTSIVPTSKPIIQKPIPKAAQPTIAFWTPDNFGEAPEHLDSEHWRELVEGSTIHPEIASQNFLSLHNDPIEYEHEAWAYLMYSDKLERSNIGRLSTRMLRKYAHLEHGGWWCRAGVDPRGFAELHPGDKPTAKIWGCYKPNQPRENPDKPGKKIKYEHPPKTELSIFLLDVPHHISARIYEKAGVIPTDSERQSGFWYCVWKYNLPVTITEGAKKAACLLSQGHAAIGLPGIYAGYRSQDEWGELLKARLIDELAVFATPRRKMTFCFDYETRPETQRNIDIAISRTGRLLEEQGAKVSVVTLPGPDKGVDDLIVAMGPLTYEKAFYEALTLKAWREHNNQQRHSPEKGLENQADLVTPCVDEGAHHSTQEAPSFSSSPNASLPCVDEGAHSSTQKAHPFSSSPNASLPASPKKLSDQEHQQRLKQHLFGQLTQLQLQKVIDELTNQELLYLEQVVEEYFAEAVAQAPALIDTQALEIQMSQLQLQIDSLWNQHALQQQTITSMERYPLHKLSHKYDHALDEQLKTLDEISELVAQKQQLQSHIQQWETQVENHQNWEKQHKTVVMKTIAKILKSPQLQERFMNIKEKIKRQERQSEAELSIERESLPQSRRGMSC